MRSEKKVTVFITIFFIMLSFFFNSFPINAEINKKIILIDPGHGGIDGGAVARDGTIEKDINLDISLQLKKKLEELGFQVLMTRDKDTGLYGEYGTIRNKKHEDLGNRCKLKKESGCDLFISIHQNMYPSKSCRGAQVWYADDDDSREIARAIQQELKEQVDSTNKRLPKAARDNYKVLRCYNNPSVLVECGFLSNPEESNKLTEENYQKSLAVAIATAIKEFFNK